MSPETLVELGIHECGVKSLCNESGSCSESDSTARVEFLRVLLCGSLLLVQEVVSSPVK